MQYITYCIINMEIDGHDTLVLNLQCFDTDSDSEQVLDVFYFYDYKTDLFSLRGNVIDATQCSGPFSFECDSASQVAEFSRFIVLQGKLVCKMYAMKDLPKNASHISYDILKDTVDTSVVLYEKREDVKNKLSTENFTTFLNQLKHIYTAY